MSEEAVRPIPVVEIKEKDTAFLQTNCREVWWTCKQLPSSKQVAKDDKRDMVATTEGTVSGFSISKRIFNSKHPSIQKVNEVFRDFAALRDNYTIVKSASASDSNNRFQVDPGKRIIRVTDIVEFETKFFELKNELRQAVATVGYCLTHEKVFEQNKPAVPSIMDMDQKHLGKSFNVKDYPSPEALDQLVTVTSPQYGVMEVDKLLPPAVLKRETERVQQELGDTVALATQRIIAQIVEAMDTLVRGLSQKEQLDPIPEDDFAKELISHYPVDLLNVYEPRHDRNLAADEVKLELAWNEQLPNSDVTGSTDTKRVTITRVVKKIYLKNVLRPQKIDAKRQLRESAVANLIQTFSWLQQVQPMIGENGLVVQKSLAEVKKLLDDLSPGHSTAKIMTELKSGDFAAGALRERLGRAIAELSEQSQEVVDVQSRRKFLI